MNDIWDGTAVDLTWLSSKTPINILQIEEGFARHRLHEANKILRAIQLGIRYRNRKAKRAGHSQFEKDTGINVWIPPPYWLALNATEPMYGWMLSPDQLDKRETQIKARMLKYRKDLKRIEDILRDRQDYPPAAAAASEEYQ